jgi:NADPH2:quinone reductase
MASETSPPSTMKALQLTRPSPEQPPTLTLTTLPIPSPPPNHLLIRLTASPLNPSDLLNSLGAFQLTTYPRIPGRDFAGTVVAPSTHPLHNTRAYGTSGSVLGFTTDGAHAEYLSCPEYAVQKIPDGMSDIQASLVGVPYTTALIALRRAGLQPGESVLILGASGAVGSAAVQVATALGAKVLSAARGATGPDSVDLKSDPALSRVLELTDGKGVNVVFDTVGVSSLTSASVEVLAAYGRLVFIAAPRSGPTDLSFKMEKVYRKQQALLGVNSLLVGLEEMGALVGELTGWFGEGKMEAPKERGVERVGLDGGVQAYGDMKGGAKKKFVIFMGEGDS